MSKVKLEWRCQECGYISPQWIGKCSECGQWSTMVEETTNLSRRQQNVLISEPPISISEVSIEGEERLSTKISELDRVLGGGIVPGALILVGGEPGIGKSTLLLQVANNISENFGRALLVSGEESVRQVRIRAERVGTLSKNLLILSGTDLEQIEQEIENLSPPILIIDSIQTMYLSDVPSAPGSLIQVRECTGRLMQIAKKNNLAVFITGHVTKDGSIAGPRVLEHIVDTVLYFEGERHQNYRIIRAVKNRFGSTNEIGIFEMKSGGLVEVKNPSALFLMQRSQDTSGSVVVATVEGTRPLLVELQALITPSYLAVPRRLTNGFDFNRLVLILAVLERRVGVHFEKQDVYVSLAGGIRISEPAVDLGVALAAVSAFKDIKVPSDLIVFGEIGLGGEVRFVSQTEQRVKEAINLGFKKIILPAENTKMLGNFSKCELLQVKTIEEAIAVIN